MAGVPWTFLSNHGLTLVCIAHDPGIRMREIAGRVGITERAAQRLVGDLVEAGYVDRERQGRRNRYAVRGDAAVRLPLPRDVTLGELLDVLTPAEQT